LSKLFYPHIPFKTIDKVNHAIDNPSKALMKMQDNGIMDPKMLDVMGLTKHGHRKYNHSLPTSIMAAFLAEPNYAAELAMVHLLADKMGNMLHDAVGSDDKDIMEGMINKSYAMFKASNGIPSRKKKMNYWY